MLQLGLEIIVPGEHGFGGCQHVQGSVLIELVGFWLFAWGGDSLRVALCC